MISHKKETEKNWVSGQTCFIFDEAESLVFAGDPCLCQLAGFDGTEGLKNWFDVFLREVRVDWSDVNPAVVFGFKNDFVDDGLGLEG